MKRVLLITIGFSIVFASCEIKRKARISDDTAKAYEQALKDSTQVLVLDTAYNFGSITEGDKVEYNFRFKNIGKKPLIVTNVSATCGCTVPQRPEEPVLPGETGFIKVVFNSRGKVGPNNKSITVYSNANPEFPLLFLRGEVKEKQ